MIERRAQAEIARLLRQFPAVGILGPRQIGKTTLALQLASNRSPEPLYLDLEDPGHQARLSDPTAYFRAQEGRLIILDEIQRLPEIFTILRGTIDRRRRAGEKTGQYLVLGSASLDLLRQSSESLTGRIAYKELAPFTVEEVWAHPGSTTDTLWLRGGFPDSFLAETAAASLRWRQTFIRNYLEREVPQLGPRIPAVTLRRLWTMLAHQQGGQLNMTQLGASLDLSIHTVKRYIELLEDLLLVRTLRPWFSNIGKRLVKTPKVYIRDSGIMHCLLGLSALDDVLGHPSAGASWEGFVVENLLTVLPDDAALWFYRTSAGAEVDLVIEQGTRRRIAVEIKRSTTPRVGKGFHQGCEDIRATHRFVVYSGQERFPLANKVTALSLATMMNELRRLTHV
ncbi:MAG: ATP-binding protein [Gammaproteobacteria bacterium]